MGEVRYLRIDCDSESGQDAAADPYNSDHPADPIDQASTGRPDDDDGHDDDVAASGSSDSWRHVSRIVASSKFSDDEVRNEEFPDS